MNYENGCPVGEVRNNFKTAQNSFEQALTYCDLALESLPEEHEEIEEIQGNKSDIERMINICRSPSEHLEEISTTPLRKPPDFAA